VDWTDRVKEHALRALNRAGLDVRRYQRKHGNTDLVRLLAGIDRPVVFDVGARVGEYVIRFNTLLPDCEIHAFEPSPRSFEELRVSIAGIPAVNLVPAGVGASPGEMTLLENADANLTSFLRPDVSAWGHVARETVVPVVTLDGYCAEQGVEHIDLLKIDAQGFDLEVLKGGAELISAGRVHLILVELNFASMYIGQARVDEILGYMLDRRYQLVDLYDMAHRDGLAGWCDALFVAS
jgi:FkbM family methyltransferase